ncbi:hypothetical protein VNO78_33779 [Psophocarpus tetragonolobus]|uniref:Integrator complex subunit 7 N-terminal domain-containing protein n=1 Tax=Psophocarpus tetragonolobus TaxID=3891 RepID=A0AAN9RQX6_PSOTE
MRARCDERVCCTHLLPSARQLRLRFVSSFGTVEKRSPAATHRHTANAALLTTMNGRHAIFNALDTMLKDSLERLKMMRENLCLVKIGLTIGYACEPKYAEHTATIRCLCLDGKLGAAVRLREKMAQKGVKPDVFTHNHIVNGLCKIGLLEKADLVVREMLEFGPRPNCATYNTLIKGYCVVNGVDRALYLFSTMAYAGIMPNRVTCSILVHALCQKGLLIEAKRMLEEVLKDDDEKYIPDLVTSTIFMDSYFKHGAIIQALSLWNEMLQNCTKVDVVAYNVLINGFCKSQQINLAYGYACEMFKKGLLPDAFTYNILISALCKEGKISEACYTLGVMSNMGIMPDQITYQLVIRGLCFDGEIVRAKNLLWCMLNNLMVPKPLIWNLIIDLYGRYNDLNNAFFTRDQMLAFGVCPNVFTYNALILAQVKSENFYGACSLKKEMISKGLFPDLVTYNLLIGAACNFRRLDYALKLYHEMVKGEYEPDLITYTELVRGFCIRGKMKSAEELYVKILKSGLLNDHVPVQILFNKWCKLRQPVRAFNLYQDWLESKKSFLLTVSASLYATGRFCEISDDFASISVEMLVNIMNSSSVSLPLKLAAARVLAKCKSSYSVASYKTGMELVLNSSNEEFLVAMLLSLAKLACILIPLTSYQVDFLLLFLNQERTSNVQETALGCMDFLFRRGVCDLSNNSGLICGLFSTIEEPEISLAMQYKALRVLHKDLLKIIFSVVESHPYVGSLVLDNIREVIEFLVTVASIDQAVLSTLVALIDCYTYTLYHLLLHSPLICEGFVHENDGTHPSGCLIKCKEFVNKVLTGTNGWAAYKVGAMQHVRVNALFHYAHSEEKIQLLSQAKQGTTSMELMEAMKLPLVCCDYKDDTCPRLVHSINDCNYYDQLTQSRVADITQVSLQLLRLAEEFDLLRASFIGMDSESSAPSFRTWNIGYKEREVLNVSGYVVFGALHLFGKTACVLFVVHLCVFSVHCFIGCEPSRVAFFWGERTGFGKQNGPLKGLIYGKVSSSEAIVCPCNAAAGTHG